MNQCEKEESIKKICVDNSKNTLLEMIKKEMLSSQWCLLKEKNVSENLTYANHLENTTEK